jgi:hypothetical protein
MLERFQEIAEEHSYPRRRARTLAVNSALLAYREMKKVRFPSVVWEQPPEVQAFLLRGSLEVTPQPAATALFPVYPEPAPLRRPTMQQLRVDRTLWVAPVVKTEPKPEYLEMIRTGSLVEPETFLP